MKVLSFFTYCRGASFLWDNKNMNENIMDGNNLLYLSKQLNVWYYLLHRCWKKCYLSSGLMTVSHPTKGLIGFSNN